MVINRKELYNEISKLCDGPYMIGMHGIDIERLRKVNGIDVDVSIESVLYDGLKIYSARTINGTVKMFGRVDVEEHEKNVRENLENYYYGSNYYYIIAIPCIIQDEQNNDIFLGCTNLNNRYRNHMGTRGCESTALSESVILETRRGEFDSTVDSRYILGTLKILYNGLVDFNINPEHIAFNQNKVPANVLEETKRILKYCSDDDINLQLELLSLPVTSEQEEKIREIMHILEQRLQKLYLYDTDKESVMLWETLNQLLNEKNLHKRAHQEKQAPKAIAEFCKGSYFGSSEDTIYIKFNYENEYGAISVKNEVRSFSKEYGPNSDRYRKSLPQVMPFLVDKNYEFTTSYPTAMIGGLNVPEDLLIIIARRLIENGCTLKIGDKLIQEPLDEIDFLFEIDKLEPAKDDKLVRGYK